MESLLLFHHVRDTTRLFGRSPEDIFDSWNPPDGEDIRAIWIIWLVQDMKKINTIPDKKGMVFLFLSGRMGRWADINLLFYICGKGRCHFGGFRSCHHLRLCLLLLRHHRPQRQWRSPRVLQDVVSSAHFALVTLYGTAGINSASASNGYIGVRPVFTSYKFAKL